MNAELIAPCGMNCALCSSYLAQKNDVKSQGFKAPYCAGCRPRDKQCAFIKKQCRILGSGQVSFCFECRDFPCRRLLHLDERYRERYHMSMVANLRALRDSGMERFLDSERAKWQCPKCGETLCCHNGLCYHCNLDAVKAKKKTYTWDDE